MSKKPNTLEDAIKQHGILNFEITNNNLKPALLDKYKILGEEIALLKSNFQCENCDTKEGLTFHHLINRKNKIVMPLQKYYSQRRFWANIMVLCNKCHELVDGQSRTGNSKLARQVLSNDTIEKTKKQFNIQ